MHIVPSWLMSSPPDVSFSILGLILFSFENVLISYQCLHSTSSGVPGIIFGLDVRLFLFTGSYPPVFLAFAARF